ncbi:MAG: hypothetical protein Q8O67_29385 [Deltaproteobacteria bacterium]|nr:hypothetical protein [Deltaproteobacteria bacterium]
MRSSLLVLLVAALAACSTPPPPPTGSNGFSCDGEVCTVTGPILADLTFTADKKWVLQGGVFVGDDTDPAAAPTTLTIEAGTTIFGDTATLSFLLITRGSKINAEGTREQPIVFTSAGAAGERVRGHWGGLVINGQAPVNGCSGTPCTLQGEAGTGVYGGDVDDDDSGVLRFVRIEFPGRLIDDENELNGVALQGVGSGTTVDFVQVHKGADDCIEFFGGTVSASHIVCTGIADDNVDWTFGWTGRAQFIVAQQHDDAGERGIEADNNEDNNALSPTSDPILSNLTLIGGAASNDGIKLRRGTRARIHNAVVTGFSACVGVDDAVTFDHLAAGGISISDSVFDCAATAVAALDDPQDLEAFLTTPARNNEVVDAELEDPSNPVAPDFKLKAASPARSGAVIPDDAFFEIVTFKGAVGDDDWTLGWTAYPAN